MFDYDTLFDVRSNVGIKLEALLAERNYTKAQLCKETGVSRPTIDKVLAGTITSKANFVRHIRKILECLRITPDMLMGNRPSITRNQLHAIRKTMRVKVEDIAEFAGMPAERVLAIESGEEPRIAELRDIALFLATGTRSIMGDGIFDDQIARLDDLLFEKEEERISKGCGFWGHIGILPSGSTEYLWFPISANTREKVYRQMECMDRLIVPCMNNKLLYLNLKNVKQILLLDDACDEPGFTNWDAGVDCGEIPQVIYEALDDYLNCSEYGEERDPDLMSENFMEVMKRIADKKGWTANVIEEMQQITLRYKDGMTTCTDFEPDVDSSLVSEIERLYNFDNDEYADNMLYYSDLNGAEIIVNMREISLIELPLIKTEDAICAGFLDE